MNPDTAPDPDDDLAAYVLDATTDPERREVEGRVRTDPATGRSEQRLRDVTAELGAALAGPSPAPDLRDRVLAAATSRRPGAGLRGATAPEIHAIEVERLLLVLRRLVDADWDRALDPPELRGWTIHDLAAHLAANETLLAAQLGRPLAGVPETETTNETRTAATQARHRSMTPAETIAELEAAATAVDAAVRDLDADELATTIDWWGISSSIRTALLVRAFETWTHADDIRRAVGLPHLSPPAPSLHTMARTATGWLPLMLVSNGVDLPDRPVRITLTGPGGGSFDIDLSLESEVLPAGSLDTAVEVTFDLVQFCRAVGNRLPAGGLDVRTEGDRDLGRQLVASVPALAAL